jgi:hypothetical protein
MPDHISILSLEDRDLWMKEHRDGGLPSHSWHYAWALAASGVNARLAVVRAGGARMLLPFFEREWMGTTDIATILGLSGASISPGATAPLLRWRQFAVAKGWVAGYIQLSAETSLAESPLPDELVDGNAVFLLDLRAWSFELASRTVRRKLRDAANSGVKLVDDRLVLAERLKTLYPTTMRRVGARPYYDFSSETLSRLSCAASSLLLGAELDGAIEIVALFLVAADHAEGHIIGTTERGRDLAAWLYGQGINHLRSQGVRTLNLGGGGGPGDGVYQFKERFGVAPTTFRAVRQVYDRPKYDELCRRAGVANEGAWFPAYRAPRAPT